MVISQTPAEASACFDPQPLLSIPISVNHEAVAAVGKRKCYCLPLNMLKPNQVPVLMLVMQKGGAAGKKENEEILKRVQWNPLKTKFIKPVQPDTSQKKPKPYIIRGPSCSK